MHVLSYFLSTGTGGLAAIDCPLTIWADSEKVTTMAVRDGDQLTIRCYSLCAPLGYNPDLHWFNTKNEIISESGSRFEI
jgi:hypothetical protein